MKNIIKLTKSVTVTVLVNNLYTIDKLIINYGFASSPFVFSDFFEVAKPFFLIDLIVYTNSGSGSHLSFVFDLFTSGEHQRKSIVDVDEWSAN